MQAIALTLLVIELTDSAVVLGVVAGLDFAPLLVIGPVAGVLSDRVDKRRMMIATQATMMVLAFVLGGAVLLDRATVPLVVVIAAATGTVWAIDQPARRTIVTELVEDSSAGNAVSLATAVGNAAQMIGPALVGLTAAFVDVGWCFVVNGSSYLAVLWALATLDRARLHRSTMVARARGQVREGVRFARRHPAIRQRLLALAALALLSFNYRVLVPLLAVNELGTGTGGYTALMSAISVGALVGTMACARRSSFGIGAQGVAACLYGLCFAALAVAPSTAVALVLAGAVGAMAMMVFTTGMIALQLETTPTMRGRMMGLFSMLFFGGQGVGGMLAGRVAQWTSAAWAMGFSGLAATAIGARLALGSRRVAWRLRTEGRPIR